MISVEVLQTADLTKFTEQLSAYLNEGYLIQNTQLDTNLYMALLIKPEADNIISSFMKLHDMISEDKMLSDNLKSDLLDSTVRTVVNNIKNVAQKVSADVDLSSASNVALFTTKYTEQDEMSNTLQMLKREYLSKGNATCPDCGGKLIAIDGELQCFNCNHSWGTLE